MSREPLAEAQRSRMLGLLSGGWLAQGCYVLAKLGLPDRLADGPAPVADLAEWAGVDRVALGRLLGTLAATGILAEPVPGTFALTPASSLLRGDAPGSLRDTAILYGEEVFTSFGGLLETVRTGRPAFAERHGTAFYDYLAEHPRVAGTFATAMASRRVPAVLSLADLDGVGTIVDVGGGDGGLLADLLSRRPDLRGVLLERPDAARPARQRLAAAGVADRVEVVEGSFFDAVPGGGDLYVLCRVLHNWNDTNAGRILARVRAAMPPAARLLVIEGLLAEASGPRRAAEARTRMVDLLMLVTLEGRDRTAAEYQRLLADNGLRMIGVDTPADGTESALLARP